MVPIQPSGSVLFPIGSCLGLPLQIGGAAVGVLVVAWSQKMAVIDVRTDSILRQYANIVSAALARAQDREHMYELAYIDELTGLPNRRNFYKQLQEKLAAGGNSLGRLRLFVGFG